MKTAVARKEVRGGQGPGGMGLGGRHEDSGFRVQREAIRGVLNRSIIFCKSPLVVTWGSGCRDRGGSSLGAYGSGPRRLDHTGSRKMESSGGQPADGLMWEVRRRNHGALGFRLELLGRAAVCGAITELATLRDGAYAGLHPCRSLTSFLAGFTSSGNS